MNHNKQRLGSLEPMYPFIVSVTTKENEVVDFEQFAVDKWRAMEVIYSKFHTFQDDRTKYEARKKFNFII